jgi:fluoride ion exporter CrcB/FEX
MIYPIIIAGLFGGLTRSAVGILKAIRAKRFKRFETWYFTWTVVLSAVIGVFAALVIAEEWKVALLAGYAGIDIVENFIKIRERKL